MNSPDLLYDLRGGAAWLTLNREAARNAISLDMLDLFALYLDRAESDGEARAVCITGAGDRVFCSGADLSSAFGGEEAGGGAQKFAGLLKRLAAFPKPLVARLNGHCMAGGLGLMLSCDMVYARDDVKIGTPEVKVGLFPMMIGPLILRSAARKKALEMIFTGESVTAREAEAMGLITRAVPAADLDPVVEGTLAAIGRNAPAAMAMGRQALAHVEGMAPAEAFDYLCGRLSDVLRTEDAAEGLSAFFEKRPPRWKGR